MMEFSFQVCYDELREVSSWIFSDNFESIVDKKNRMRDAHNSVMDMFISPVPLLMCFVSDKNLRPRKGQISKGVFVIPPAKFDFDAEVFMINDSFLIDCTKDFNPCEIFNILGEKFEVPQEGILQLERWSSNFGLQCVAVYS